MSGARESEVVSVALLDAAQGMPTLESMDDIQALTDVLVQATQVRPNGIFKIESIPAGDYLVLVVAVEGSLEAVATGREATIRHASGRVALSPGDEVEVDLHLN